MADKDMTERAKEIDDAVKAADAKKRADADAEGADVSLKDVLAAIGKCSEAVTAHGAKLDEMGGRLDKLEAGGSVDDDADPDGSDPVRAMVDSRKRADAITPEQRQQLAECQMAADAVCLAWNERAPMPLHGETVEAYRIRLLEPWKKHSPAFKELDLAKLAAAGGLDVAEKQIFADAVAFSNSPERVAPGQLLTIEKRLDGGHIMRTFQGHPRAWMDEFAGPVRQHVVSGLLGNEGALAN
jgi:hypothetical protein